MQRSKLSVILVATLALMAAFSLGSWQPAFAAPASQPTPQKPDYTVPWVQDTSQVLHLTPQQCANFTPGVHDQTKLENCTLTIGSKTSQIYGVSKAASPYIICCPGGCISGYQNHDNRYAFSGYYGSFETDLLTTWYYADNCQNPSLSSENCTRYNHITNQYTSISNTYCGHYASNGGTQAENDTFIGMSSYGSSFTVWLTTFADLHSNYSDHRGCNDSNIC